MSGAILMTACLMTACTTLDNNEDNTDGGTKESEELEGSEEGVQVLFSHEAGFHDTRIELTLSSSEPDATVFFTADGSVPCPDGSGTTSVFSDGDLIEIEPPRPRNGFNHVDVLSVSAIAVTGESSERETSRIFVQTFISGTGVFERFGDEVLVFALTTDPHGLFDHYDGIFVEGIDRQRWREENPGQSPIPPSPANFNRRGRESEREVHVEMFDSSGEMHISQRAGMRVRGGWSRASTQKSIGLIARREYGDRHTFRFPFFANELDLNDEVIDRYRRIRLRNGGNDRENATIRDELGHTLFRQAGLPDTQSHVPGAVFLNGEYYGAVWVKSPLTENHWARRYGSISDNFEILSECELGLDGEPRAVDDWAEFRELFALPEDESADVGERLTNQANWEEFNSRVCIDNLMLYYAMQLYIANEDWPGGNMQMWRYFESEESEPIGTRHELLDGRWRFIAQDIEFAWNLYDRGTVDLNSIETVRTGHNQMGGQSQLLDALLEREDMRQKLAETLVELMEGVFAPDNVISTMDSLIALNRNEIRYALEADLFYPDNEHWPNEFSMQDSQNLIRAFARRRAEYMVRFIYESLGISVELSG